MKKFRKNYADFWHRWLTSNQGSFLNAPEDRRVSAIPASLSSVFESGFSVFELTVAFAVAMSSSSFRHFRQAACIALLSLISCLSSIGKNLKTDMTNVQRRLDQYKGDIGQRKKFENQLRQLQAQEKAYSRHLTQLFKSCVLYTYTIYILLLDGCSVFLNRSRDVDEEIRRECIVGLGQWIMTFPDFFMNSNYLRYLGWFLSDKSTIVRQATVNAVARLLAIPNAFESLRQFSERHKSRILEMALYEADLHVRKEVIHGIVVPFSV